MYRLLLLLIIPVSSFSKSITASNEFLEIARTKINEFVSRSYKPFTLSNPRYTEGEILNSKPYYIYVNLIKKTDSAPLIYAYPYSYSTEGIGHTQSAYDKCNLLLIKDNKHSYQLENKKTNKFSPCLGFKNLKIIDTKNKVWFVATVGYMLPQSSEVTGREDQFYQELYFLDRTKKLFCFVVGETAVGKVNYDVIVLREKLSQLQTQDVTCIPF